MSGLIFYNSYNIFVNPANYKRRDAIPGGREFEVMFKIFNQNITFLDRTGTIQVPIKTHLLPFMAMPTQPFSGKSFEQICDERARELLNHANATNREILVMYSGGVDSTLVLCAFLKVATPEELKRITVLLSEKSIAENPVFYENFVVKKFKCDSSFKFPAYLGNDKFLFVTGENADQLFGSQLCGDLIKFGGFEILFESIDDSEGVFKDFLRSLVSEKYRSDVDHTYAVLHRLVDTSPVKLDNLYKFLWWINFTMKWQSVYVRLIPYAWHPQGVKLEENYTTFYSPAEFQLWSMNNSDILCGSNPGESKMVPKRYILDVNGDEGYLKKPKIGSLSLLAQRKHNAFGIDSDFKFLNEYPGNEFYNLNNDFAINK